MQPSNTRIEPAADVKPPQPPNSRQIEIARRCGRDPFEDYRRRYDRYVDRANEAVRTGLTTWDEVNAAAAAAECHVWVRVVDVVPARTRTPERRPTRSARPRARRTVRRVQSRGDPDDPDPEPAEQDLDEWLLERKQALDTLTGREQLRFDREVER